jgi:hypothetical protein
MDQPGTVAFEIRNRGGLPLPAVIQGIMLLVFAMPLIVIPMTFSEVAKHPMVLLVWLAACFPLALMYVLKRLFTRFAVALYQDGGVRITQPFTTHNISREQLATIVTRTNQAHVGGANTAARVAVPWMYFFDSADKKLAQVSPAGFDASDIEKLLGEVRRLRPDVRIQHQ